MKYKNMKTISLTKIDKIMKKLKEGEPPESTKILEMLIDLKLFLELDLVTLEDIIIQSYEERFRESDPEYCDEKIEYISRLSFNEQYAFLTEIDSFGLEDIAKKMEISVEDLMEKRKFILEHC